MESIAASELLKLNGWARKVTGHGVVFYVRRGTNETRLVTYIKHPNSDSLWITPNHCFEIEHHRICTLGWTGAGDTVSGSNLTVTFFGLHCHLSLI